MPVQSVGMRAEKLPSCTASSVATSCRMKSVSASASINKVGELEPWPFDRVFIFFIGVEGGKMTSLELTKPAVVPRSRHGSLDMERCDGRFRPQRKVRAA